MAAAKPRTHRKSARKSASPSDKRKTSKKQSTSATKPAESHAVRREIYGVLGAVITILLGLSLLSHRPASEESNWIGNVGQIVAEGMFFLFGVGSFAIVALSAWLSLRLLFGERYVARAAAHVGMALITLAIITCASVLLPNLHAWAVPVGGWVGASIAGAIVGVIGRAGAVLVLVASALIGAILVTRASLVEVTSNAVQRVQDTGDKLRITDGMRAVGGGVTGVVGGIFKRRAPKEAPALPEASSSVFIEDERIDDDVHRPSDAADESAAALPQRTAADAEFVPALAHVDAAEEIPVHVQSLEREDASSAVGRAPETAAPAAMPADAPIIRPRAHTPLPASPAPEAPVAARSAVQAPAASNDASSVAARARRAIEAFRRNDAKAETPAPASAAQAAPAIVAPAQAAPPIAPIAKHAAAPTSFSPPTEDDLHHVPIAERSDHAIHNPMIDTTRQNTALDADDFLEDDAPLTTPPPAPAAPAAPAAPIAEPQRLETDIGLEDVEAAPREESYELPEISRPASAARNDWSDEDLQEEDLQEQDTRPVQLLNDDFEHEEPAFSDDVDGSWDDASASDDFDDDFSPQIIESAAKSERFTSETMEQALRAMEAQRERDAWTLPSLDMLSYEESSTEIDEEGLRAMAALLVEALADYKVKGRVTGICPGPVVTRFEFEPEPGTKLSKISGLSTDIAMRLRAENVRIIAPIPGKGCVGVEIPNDIRETVFLKEILADRRFTQAKSKLALALGKDIEGFPVVADLAKMPHLLVAGTTGSGKSVAINSMIMSALYNASPDDVRMILIDPKQLEFALYEDIPHLLLPVVTDPSQAATALQWAVDEMERRYRLMKELRVRNLEGYNEKLKLLQQEVDAQQQGGKPASKFALDALSEQDRDGRPTHRHMPYLIVVVDEFADLMMAAGKDVEIAVARIAQKARAAGIHCILATQRPSVDVLTGTIKSNFPTRISFRLISGTDSRTVIDTVGAEDLLGMGDMLYRPPGSSDLVRVHGAFVDEDEIERVVNFVKDQREAEFDQSILSAQVEASESDGDVDPKFDDAVEVVVEAGYASISMVQRRLSVGYNRAANIVEEMERRGIIGPSGGGASRREVLV